MIIREFKKQDINSIEKLGLLLHDNYKFSLDDFSKCLVISNKEQIIGFIVFSIIYERAEIVDIIINNKERRKGYAIDLINKAIEIISKFPCENITLEVDKNNIPAINLYKKLGFELVATRKNYYDKNDAYLMKKDLR